MIINSWDPLFTRKYGYHFPDSYLCFDTEFTGSDSRTDLVVEIGHTMVEKGQVVDRLSVVLNWYNHPEIEELWLDYKLNKMRSIVGPNWRLSPATVKKEGMDPIQALRFYYKLLSTWKQRELFFVAQNGAVDERLLGGNFSRFLHKTFEIPNDAYFDTGGLFKANQIWESNVADYANLKLYMLPHHSENLKSYFHRVIYTKVSGLKWSLGVILDHYDLVKQYNLDTKLLHTAGADAECLHWVMERYRQDIQPPKLLDDVKAAEELALHVDLQQYNQQAKKAEPIVESKPSTVKTTPPTRRQRLV